MHSIVAYLLARLAEASTWRGLIALATAGGIAISPDLAEAIVAAGLACIGLVGALTPDAPPEPADPAGPEA